MKKILLILSFLSANLFAFSDGQYVAVSSNSYYNLNVNSNTTTISYDTATPSSASVRQIVFTNTSSSSTVYFSSSSAQAFTLASGTPLFPQEHLTIDIDPDVVSTTALATAIYWIRQDGSTEAGSVPVRMWLRFIRGRR